MSEPVPATVVVMCGLPASGKTTTAERLHAALGGTLIRSCDVYQRLGIYLPDWVARTRGLTENVAAYECVRDGAYVEMARLLEQSLANGAALVIVDAVHGERSKRTVVFDLCRRYGAAPVLVWCRCDDFAETQRRLSARRDRETEPEHEASDVSVYHHLLRLWDDPLRDAAVVAVTIYDTDDKIVRWLRRGGASHVDGIAEALNGQCARG